MFCPAKIGRAGRFALCVCAASSTVQYPPSLLLFLVSLSGGVESLRSSAVGRASLDSVPMTDQWKGQDCLCHNNHIPLVCHRPYHLKPVYKKIMISVHYDPDPEISRHHSSHAVSRSSLQGEGHLMLSSRSRSSVSSRSIEADLLSQPSSASGSTSAAMSNACLANRAASGRWR